MGRCLRRYFFTTTESFVMRTPGGTPRDPTGGDPITLSTGPTVVLPLTTEATMLGAVFSVPREPVEALLPSGLRPITVTPGGDVPMTLLSVEYHRIGVEGIEPYDEFAVVFPAVHRPTLTLPYLSAIYRATRGFVWYLPVTTEPAKALGVDVWGYPKVVADITHEDDGPRRSTTVVVDGERFVTLEVRRPPSVRVRDDAYSYTVMDDEVLRVPVDVDAELGAWPFSADASVSFGPHRRADPLRGLPLGSRALGRIGLHGTVRFHPGEPIR